MAVARQRRVRYRPGPYDLGRMAVGYAAGRAVGSALRPKITGTRTHATSREFSAPAPITGESDWRSLYRRKRYPRRKKKRWVRFVRKVKHILHKQVQPQYNVIVRTDDTAVAANKQGFTDMFTVLNGTGELSYLFDRALAVADTEGPALTSTTKEQLKIGITGYLAEVMLTNISSPPNLAYVDCYYWRTKRDVPVAITGFTNLWIESLSDIGANVSPTVTETTLSADDYGVTPFQGVQLAKSVQIWKKTRIKIPPGGNAQLELRSGHEYYRRWSYDEHYSLLKGMTQGIFFVIYGGPTAANEVSGATRVISSANFNYTWRIVQDNRMKGMHDLP